MDLEATRMLLDRVFEPFLQKRPVCVMARAVLENLLDPERIDALFERSRQRQYEKELLFSTLVELMSVVTLKIQPSVHAAYQSSNLEVSVQALYKKLDGVERTVSAELVRDSARQAGAVIDALNARLEPWLAGYRCRVLDGNHLSATEHRLEELRTTWAAPLPGKVLVVLDPERMLAGDVFLTEDGHAQERSLLDEVLETVLPRDVYLQIAERHLGELLGVVGSSVSLLDTIGRSVGLAVVVALFAPLGDLAESLLKRDLQIKDMGGILPGHGGVMDRIDSVLFVAPAAFIYLRLILL
jgi:hypothetical protein